VNCPICACEWPVQPTRCVCGFDFETGSAHEAVRSLTIQYKQAHRRWLWGLVTFVSSAVTLVLAGVYPAFMIAMPIVLSMQVLFGLGLIATGLRSGIRLGRQIARGKSMNQLPAARLLK
jgi:hypothetical protein